MYGFNAFLMHRRRLIGLLGGGALVAFGAFARGQGKGKGQDKPHGKPSPGKKAGGPVFSPADRTAIHAYVREAPGFLGVEARGLPPGLAKNVQRGKPLPPGWQKKIAGFPPALEQRLPLLPVGYRRVVVDRWAFVIAEATNTVVDVLDLVKNR